MKVAELLVHLKSAPPDAVVLAISVAQNLSYPIEIGQVHKPREPWIREYLLQYGGEVASYLRPANRSRIELPFNPARDEAYEEGVVIISSESMRFNEGLSL
ncbi:hypothetical protein CBA19CS22_16355 [Caballeronia novacaledonica]|uniref:Uncharacterized protein n=1 Tax=Caballeronia novacaledonica TaxID=1544861 RepID=A0ACB5QU27_9BURK|nr:hypothetical protein CBA19CS22_16355 [Caballeronia novacaledonica]